MDGFPMIIKMQHYLKCLESSNHNIRMGDRAMDDNGV